MFLTKRAGTPYYQVVYQDGKTKKAVSTKAKTKSDALKFLTEFKENLEKKPKIDIITLSRFTNLYLDHIKIRHSLSHYKANKTTFNRLLLSVPDMELKEIKPLYLENFILTTFQKSKTTASLDYRNLSSAFNKAIEWQFIIVNPLAKIKKPKPNKPLPATINNEELNQILSITAKQDLKDIFVILYNTGMRINELLNLYWQDVDLSNRLIKISNKANFTTKNKKERLIPVNNTVYNILIKKQSEKIRQATEYIFNKNGFKYNSEYISKEFKKAVRTAGLNERIHLHSIRHSFCSNLVNKNISLYTIKELAGHNNIATTQIYSHLDNSVLRDAVNLLD